MGVVFYQCIPFKKEEKVEENNSELKRVPIEYLWEGITLLDNLYNYTGEVLLLRQGIILTADKLEKLVKFESGNHFVTTYDATYSIIMEKNAMPQEIRQKRTEDEFGYTRLKKGIENILHVAHQAQKISDMEVKDTIQSVTDKLNTKETNTIFECINMPRPMDEALQRHCLNVGFLNGLMGEWLGLPKKEKNLLVTAGVLHDIGKTKISEDILNAPRKLTEEEFAVIKMHPTYSYELLGDGFDERVKMAALYHHEKNDGTGYPNGLKMEQIPLFARVTAITDVYDAMVSRRSYKEEKVLFNILEGFYANDYKGLDEKLTAVFLINMRKQLLEKEVQMSDGTCGIVKYIPPNDFDHPVVAVGEKVEQTSESWYCIGMVD